MDNVTHTLIGVTLARAVSAGWPAEPGTAKEAGEAAEGKEAAGAVTWTAVLASNVPDLDPLLPQSLIDGQLGYLLQHRGWTHTFLIAPILGFLCAWGVMAVGRVPRTRRPVLFSIGIAAALLHVGADWWNEYGVHPFSPFHDRWYYGDFVFIVEPLMWFSMLPLAFAGARYRTTRGLCVLATLLMLGLLWLGPFVGTFTAVLATVWLGLVAGFQFRAGASKVSPALLAVALVLGSFFIASHTARARVAQWFGAERSREEILQLALAPSPANPICWRIAAASRERGSSASYFARTGSLSLLPALVAPDECRLRGLGAPRAPLKALDSGRPDLAWSGEFSAPWNGLADWRAQSCAFDAFLRFARVPFWFEENAIRFAGDLRYSRGDQRGGFADLKIEEDGGPCARFVPRWEPPIEARIK